jgi:hypothetical protein
MSKNMSDTVRRIVFFAVAVLFSTAASTSVFGAAVAIATVMVVLAIVEVGEGSLYESLFAGAFFALIGLIFVLLLFHFVIAGAMFAGLMSGALGMIVSNKLHARFAKKQ